MLAAGTVGTRCMCTCYVGAWRSQSGPISSSRDGMGWDGIEERTASNGPTSYSSADEGACVTLLALAYYLLGAVDYCTLPPCTRTREGQDFIRLPQIVHPRQARRPEAHSQLEDFH